MSRHRNVRNMMEEDYYDYDDDDDYDDYDDAGYAAPPKPKPKPAPKKTTPQPKTKQPSVTVTPAMKSPAPATTTSAAVSVSSPLKTVMPAPPLSPPPGFSKATTTSSSTTFAPAAAAQQQQPAPASSSTTNIAPPPPVPSILLNEPSDKKRNLTIVILGHVDAGKSTVTGHLLYQANNTSLTAGPSLYAARTNKPQNWAWLLDEDEQERAHGITMDIATKTLQTPRFNIVLQDAPGHADYVPATITGTANATAALLVVDATDYSTALQSGQFKQHAYLARGLGVMQLLVVVNKMDLVSWNQKTFDQVKTSAVQFLVQTVGYAPAAVRCVPVSGLTGTNITKQQDKNNTNNNNNADENKNTQQLLSWYTGPTLLQAMDSFFENQTNKSGQALLQKPLRIVLTDVIDTQGKNRASIRGKVLQGWVKAGEKLVIMPLADETTIQKLSSLHTASNTDASGTDNDERRLYAAAGEMIDAVLTGVDGARILVGNTLARPQSRPVLANTCRARIWVLEGLTVPLIRGAQAVFYLHHLQVPCHVSKLVRTFQKDGKTVAKERPRAIGSNTQAEVELTLSYAIVMEAFEDCRGLGRFVLRRGGNSVAVGRIEQVIVQ